MKKLTRCAPLVVGRLRQFERQKLHPNPVNDVSHATPKLGREVDLHPAPRSAVPHVPTRYLDIEHLFEAQCLRAQLKVCGVSVPRARLVFDGPNPVIVDLDRISAPGQPQCFRPEGDGAQYLAPPFTAMPTAIDPAMRADTSDRMGVVAPDAVAMDKRALTRTVREVFDGGDWDDRLDAHNRSAPNALVGSAEALRRKGTARQPAWTPTGDQACRFSGFQASSSASMPFASSG